MKIFTITMLLVLPLLAHAEADEIAPALVCLIDKACIKVVAAEQTVFGSNTNLKTYRTNTGQTALQFILASGDTSKTFALATRLLEKKVDINAQGSLGLTSLHDGVLFDNIEVVKFLIEKGAKVSRQAGPGKFNGKNVLEFAEYLQEKTPMPNRKKIIKILRENVTK
jgi:ankyrin repeat protein